MVFTFKSAGLPVLLILVIQGSVWINFSFPYLMSQNLFFLSYLVVSSIQMGANIDYAIVIANRYTDLKKEMPLHDAVVESLNEAFPTIITSGSILASAGVLIGFLSSNPAIASIGVCLGRGTLISIFLVMGILPQILLLGDVIIEKTAITLKHTGVLHAHAGAMRIHGHVRGYVSDLLELAKNCTLDTWSQGKTVQLEADLDLSGSGFTAIPTFGGTFQGNNHTISGLFLTIDGSHQGLFRYLQPGGQVTNLTVRGTVAPSGSAEQVGGIVGQSEPDVFISNSGALSDIRTASDRLSSLVDQAISHADHSIADISAHLSAIGTHADSARDDAQDLPDRTGNLLDTNIDAVNDLSVSITGALDRISPAMDDLSDAAGKLAELTEELEPVMNRLADASGDGRQLADDLGRAMESLQTALDQLRKGASDGADMGKALQDAF